jgi:5-methylcytosine-specific restriction endonuclease McrA
MKVNHVALYGNTRIVRVYCRDCDSWTFVLDGARQCCGTEVDKIPTRATRISETVAGRRRPPPSVQREILLEQEYRCFYCFQQFGTRVLIKNKLRTLVVHWDHLVPYAYARNSSIENFVAACSICNGWKSSLVFQTVDEARLYIDRKWESVRSGDDEC